MTATLKEALITLRPMARGQAGASSGESAAGEIFADLRDGAEVDFAGYCARLDSCGKRAVVEVLRAPTAGGTGRSELN